MANLSTETLWNIVNKLTYKSFSLKNVLRFKKVMTYSGSSNTGQWLQACFEETPLHNDCTMLHLSYNANNSATVFNMTFEFFSRGHSRVHLFL